MALTSFTLRKQVVGYGSYLREDSRTGSRSDSSLRADNLSETALTITGANTFSANILNPTTVRLEWGLEEPLVLESTIVGASAFYPVELIIASSTTGEPVSVSDGSLVGAPITANTVSSFYDDEPSVIPGRWVYYSLFTKYSNGEDYWYQRSATLYIQIPIQYESLASLWNRIPEYYRTLDGQQEELSSGLTPLYAFLDLFGNEIDRTRTLIDSVALSNDPSLAATPALAELAYETGLEIGINDLGTSKTRSLLNNIGSLRQRKGTIGSVISYISAMSGCGASYQYSAGASFPHVFHVNAQRVNFISDPKFTDAGITETSGYVTPTNSHQGWLFSTNTWGVFATTPAPFTAGPNVDVVNNSEGIIISLDPLWSTSPVTVRVYPRKSFMYDTSIPYYTSFDFGASAGAVIDGVHLSSYGVMYAWENSFVTKNYSTNMYIDAGWNNISTMLQDSPQRRVFQYSPQVSPSFDTLEVVPVVEFTLTAGQAMYIGRWLWEPNYVGNYFDGNTRDGGFIPSTSGVAGQGVFDYFWGDGGANSDFSYYLLDRQRTIETTERVLSQYVVPVTMVNKYIIDWNYYTGKT